VSSKHTLHLREAHYEIRLREHYGSINSWTHAIYEDVWWSPHGTAISRFSIGEKNTLQKFFHNRLPCNGRENRYYPYIPEGCSKCGQLEHQMHIIKCEDCELRVNLRKKYLIDVKRYLSYTHTNTNTIIIIMECLTAYLSARDPESIEDLILEPGRLYQRVYWAQEDIGWEEWFKGRISKTWGELYAHDLETTNHNMPHQTPEKWATTLIMMTWQFVLDSWTIRNEIEHGLDTDPLMVRKQKIIRKILWQQQQILYIPNNNLSSVTEDTLKSLPLDNLLMTESQLQLLIRASKTRALDVEQE
jgi:hypothetical protein